MRKLDLLWKSRSWLTVPSKAMNALQGHALVGMVPAHRTPIHETSCEKMVLDASLGSRHLAT